MFQNVQPRSTLQSVIATGELIYHATVRSIRTGHGNALLAILSNMMVSVLFVLAFYVMFTVLGLKGTALRGDFLLYIMSGIFLFMTHTKALGAVVGAACGVDAGGSGARVTPGQREAVEGSGVG